MKHASGWLGALVLAAASCATSNEDGLTESAQYVLRGADRLELIALDPAPLSEGEGLHGYRITGRVTVFDAKVRTELVDLVLRGIRESDGSVAACFIPRHGIRAQYQGRTLDLVICYECLSMTAYGDALGGGMDRKGILTSPSVEPAVTKIFESAGLQIATK